MNSSSELEDTREGMSSSVTQFNEARTGVSDAKVEDTMGALSASGRERREGGCPEPDEGTCDFLGGGLG